MNLRHSRNFAYGIRALAFFAGFGTLPFLSVTLSAKSPAKKNAAAPVKAAKAGYTPQELVAMGKRPAFFNPKDLSQPPALSAKSVILMDADTQQVLWEKNADELRAPASTTKIMTGLLLAENTKPTDIVTCLDPTVVHIEESSLHIKPWEKFTAQNLLYGLLLRSANDGAVVTAEHISGSVSKFADLMNARATEIGASNTHFTNPNGLFNPYHYTTARDLGKIACVALQNERFADAVRIPRRKIARSKETRDIIVASKAHEFYRSFPGADGVKTGYVKQSGNCFVGSATRDGRRLLGVILGAKSNASGEMQPLLSWGFRRFAQMVVARKGTVVGQVSVNGGNLAQIRVLVQKPLHYSYDTLNLSAMLPQPTTLSEIIPLPSLTAPLAKGSVAGRLAVRWNGKEIESVPVYTTADVAPAPVVQGGTSHHARCGAIRLVAHRHRRPASDRMGLWNSDCKKCSPQAESPQGEPRKH